MLLTSTQIQSYHDQGFLILPDFVTHSECDELMSEADTLVHGFEPGETRTRFSTVDQERITNDYFLSSSERVHFFFEPDAFKENGEMRQEKHLSINKIGHAMHDLNPVFSRFSRKPSLAQICEDLGVRSPLLLQSMYIFKQPRIGGEVTCHQDATFLYTDPMSTLGFWFALQDATLQNGCLYALPGGHRSSLRRRFRRTESGKVIFDELDPTPIPKEGYLPLEVKKGTLIILHGLLPHLSGPNSSDYSRHAYTLHVIDGTAHYPEDNWLQRSAENPARGF